MTHKFNDLTKERRVNDGRGFAGNLRKFRELKGWTQTELAKEAGLTQSWISHFEAGRRKPTLDTLQKLTSALGCTLEELL